MATNYVQEGRTITLVAPSPGVESGDPVKVGNLFGVANYDAATGLPVEVTVKGVWDLPKAATIVFVQGALVYFDATAVNVTSVTTGNFLIGAATQSAASGDATARVRLNESSLPAASA
jgi:predicted RecA/RadA family phage recombinase